VPQGRLTASRPVASCWGRVTPSLPAPGGRRGRTTSTSAGGVCNLFLVCEPLAGWRRVTVSDRRTLIDGAHSDHGAGRGPRPRRRADRAGPGQPRAPTPRRRWIRGSDRPSQAAGRSAGAARHPLAWQLGQHGRDRAGHAGWTGGWPTRRSWRGGRGVAGGAQPGRSWGQLAVHHRRCSHQAPAPLPPQLRADELLGCPWGESRGWVFGHASSRVRYKALPLESHGSCIRRWVALSSWSMTCNVRSIASGRRPPMPP
jgi:hypothetical protein